MAYLPVLPRSVLVSRKWKRGAAVAALIAGATAISLWQTRETIAASAPPVAVVAAPIVAAPIVAASGVALVGPRRFGPEAFAMDMAPVIADGGLRVVLRDRVEKKWLAGSASMTDDEGVTVVTRPLSAAGRTEVSLAIGARLRLFAADGGSCVARVVGAVALGRLDAGDALDQDASAAGAWAAAGDSVVVAGDLEPLQGRCNDVLWARSEGLAAPRLAVERDAEPELRRTAQRALRQRPEYRDLTDGSGSERIEVSTLFDGGETLVVTTFVAKGCVGPTPALVGLWRLDGDHLTFLGAEEQVTEIVAGADVDGDGRMELLATDDMLGSSVLRRATERFHIEQQAQVPVLGCRC